MRLDMLLARARLIENSRPSIDYCRDYGIDFEATVPACGGVFLAEIAQTGSWFDPCPGGVLSAWCEALAEDAEAVLDVVAWPVDQPGNVMTLGGVAPALGMAHAANPATYAFGGPLRLFRTPLSWLQSDCGGAVFLDSAAGSRWLLDVPASKIAAEDDAHAREIARGRRALIGHPAIVVPKNQRAPSRRAA